MDFKEEVPLSNPLSNAVKNALAVLDRHIVALNNHDEEALQATLHFPHIRLSATELKMWPTPESYFADFKKRAGGAWHRSEFHDIKVLAESDSKVHLDAEIIRYNHSNEIISRFRSLWVVTKQGAHWAAKLRSSFAAQ